MQRVLSFTRNASKMYSVNVMNNSTIKSPTMLVNQLQVYKRIISQIHTNNNNDNGNISQSNNMVGLFGYKSLTIKKPMFFIAPQLNDRLSFWCIIIIFVSVS